MQTRRARAKAIRRRAVGKANPVTAVEGDDLFATGSSLVSLVGVLRSCMGASNCVVELTLLESLRAAYQPDVSAGSTAPVAAQVCWGPEAGAFAHLIAHRGRGSFAPVLKYSRQVPCDARTLHATPALPSVGGARAIEPEHGRQAVLRHRSRRDQPVPRRGSAWPITRLTNGKRARSARSTSSTRSCTSATVSKGSTWQ
jgi:hypothetical protein